MLGDTFTEECRQLRTGILRSTGLSDYQKTYRANLVIFYWLEGRSFKGPNKQGLILRQSDDIIERLHRDRLKVFSVLRKLFLNANYVVEIPESWKCSGDKIISEFPWSFDRNMTIQQLRWVRTQGWVVNRRINGTI